MRKRFAAVTLLVTVLISMMACGSSRTQVTSESVEKKDDSIRIWAWDDTFNAKAAKLAAERYREKHPQAPQIEVTTKEREEILSDVKLLLSSQVYDQLPDVIMIEDYDGYTGFLFLDKDGMPLVAMHWEHRFNHMVSRYNEIYKVQIPNITPHVCRHTYCSNMAKSGMNPKTLQYLMGHSDIAVTLNVYTHVGLEDAEKELQKMQGLENARKRDGNFGYG